jgi:toxin secretion/phage lysis holin
MGIINNLSFAVGHKTFIAALVGVFAYIYHCLNELFIILTLLILIDYITGIVKIFVNDDLFFDSKKAIKGAVKKLMYFILILMGFLADFIMNLTTDKLSVDIETNGTIGIIVALYLIANEAFSTLQNLIEIGLPVPKILLNFYGKLKDDKGETT